jgi:hypothetical protein
MSYEIMTNAEYHAHPALGSTSIKRALVHPALVNAPSTINPKVAEEGNRLHTAVIEPDMLHQRYTVAPDPDDYPEALKTSDEMRAALKLAAPSPDDYPDALRTAGDMRNALKAAGVKGFSSKPAPAVLAAVREHLPDAVIWADIVERSGFDISGISGWPSERLESMVRDSLPNALLWSDVLSVHAKEGAGKTFVSSEEWAQMERCADAVAAHPVIQAEGIFSEGIGEASFFSELTFNAPAIFGRVWEMKARPDWLQPQRVSDLKSWRGGRDVSAFFRHASDLHYDLSAAHYLEVLAAHGHTSDRFTWVIVDKATLHAGGHVLIHVATMSPEFLAQGREKLAVALERFHDWQSSPRAFDRCNQIEHTAEPPRWGWRKDG